MASPITEAATWRSRGTDSSTLMRYLPFPGTTIWKPGDAPFDFPLSMNHVPSGV